MKKIFVGLFMFLFVGILAACTMGQSVEASDSYLLVEINPKIEFTLDDEEKVVSVDLLNEDAEIAALHIDFIGMTADEALDAFLDAALEAGFLDVDSEDNAIFITLYSDDEDYEDEVRDRVRNHVEAFLVRERIKGGVFDGQFSHEDIQAIADEYDVRFNQARAAYAVSEAFEDITLEEAIEMPFTDLMTLLRTRHQDRMQARGEQVRAFALEMREALTDENRERLEAHRANFDNIPEEMIRDRMEAMHRNMPDRVAEMREAHESRQRERRDDVNEDE